jgi:phosphatidylserine decarboxylase
MPLRCMLPPIHPDGWKFIAAAALLSAIASLFSLRAGYIGLNLLLWIVYFFRDPWRVTPNRAGLIVSPADGVIVSLGPAPAPPELDMDGGPMTRIGIFLSLFDVHVARAPIGGRVAARHYTKGRFLNASLDKASSENERLALRIAAAEAQVTGATGDTAAANTPDVAFVLIAGLIARRIVCPLFAGQRITAGERIGIIRFGSRVDVYCPPPFVPLVVLGQRTIGGETVLADSRASEPPREGIAH